MKFKKKPVVIEAFQWTGNEKQREDPVWAIEKIKDGTIFFSRDDNEELIMKIKTLEGVMTANQEDWIIKGISDEVYPCKPDIFEKTYTPVLDDAEVNPPDVFCHDLSSNGVQVADIFDGLVPFLDKKLADFMKSCALYTDDFDFRSLCYFGKTYTNDGPESLKDFAERMNKTFGQLTCTQQLARPVKVGRADNYWTFLWCCQVEEFKNNKEAMAHSGNFIEAKNKKLNTND